MHPPSDSEGFQIGALLAIPAHALEARVFAAYAAAGFTDLRPAHTPVFQLLPAEGARVTDLAARAQMTKQAMGYLVSYLEAQGYLERAADPRDGRAQLVRRTARGWAVNQLARRVVEDVQQEWAEHLGPERMRELRTLLADLVHIVGVSYEGSVSQLSVTPERNAL